MASSPITTLCLCAIAAVCFMMNLSPARCANLTAQVILDPMPEYWKLVLRWPPSYCVSPGIKCHPNYPRNAFVIEAVVGVVHRSTAVATCDVSKQPPLDPSKVAIYEKIFSEIWPSLDGDNFKFWERQWQTYAACFGLTPEYYFNGLVGLKVDVDRTIVNLGFNGKKYDGEQIYGTLALQNVLPGNFYHSDQLMYRIYSKFGAYIETYCNFDVSGKSQFLQVDFCGSHHTYRFHLMPCPILASYGCYNIARYT